jgi:S1-C subfamily serine protease
MNQNLLNAIKSLAASRGAGVLLDPGRVEENLPVFAGKEAAGERKAFIQCLASGLPGELQKCPDRRARLDCKNRFARHLAGQGFAAGQAGEIAELVDSLVPAAAAAAHTPPRPPAAGPAPPAGPPPRPSAVIVPQAAPQSRRIPPFWSFQRPALKAGKAKIVIIAVSLAAAAAIGIFLFTRPWSPQKIYASYKDSVVMMYGAYSYELRVDDQIVGNLIIDENGEPAAGVHEYSGTGFFVSRDGKVATNRHVALPWLYDGEADYLKKLAQKEFRGDVQVSGQFTYIGFFLNDTYVTGLQDLIECAPQSINTGSRADIDVAVMQTKSKTLPAGIKNIVDVYRAAVSDKAHAVGTTVCTIGFPAGFDLGLTVQGIAATAQEGKITQERGDVEFGLNAAVEHGASGSPVFNQYGQLVGVINAGYEKRQGFNMAIKAKHVLDLMK